MKKRLKNIYFLCTAPPNEPPVANAGRDVTMQLPENSVTLDGRGSTDDTRVVAYQWSQVSGPTNIDVGNEESSLLDLSNLKPGEYEFSLTVFDQDGLFDDDTVKITVIGMGLFSMLLTPPDTSHCFCSSCHVMYNTCIYFTLFILCPY